MSSEEIEDVVSSVRRLVSNEQRPRTLSRDLGADRLLLTPSFRVVADANMLAPLILEQPLPGAAVAPQIDPPPAEDVTPEAVVAPPDDDAVELIEAVWEEALWVDPEPPSLGEVALGADEAEVLATPPERAGPEDMAETWAQVGTEWVEDEPVTFIPLRRRSKEGQEPAATKAASGDAGFEPDEPEVPTFGSHEAEAQATAALLEAAMVAEARATTHRIATEILDADGTPLAVLDESALQDIVRIMIRAELQGQLGERITRNVRKLVRAEINRALVERDLD
ncbi:hypothetical protein [Tabrizicola sp.]|uniref:hypothetical protein n=1 Tax=Tabrizicola sp. TaxID=2005166 RepID=UPI003F341F24